MATQETKKLDEIISSRRAVLLGGGALAVLALGQTKAAQAASTVTSYSDTDILNFALNLEYLEANFYYLAAFGTTIDVKNTQTTAAGSTAPLGINGLVNSGSTNPTAGITATFGTATRVPFTTTQVASYAVETAIEEGKHVTLLRSALGGLAVAQPPIDVSPTAFTAVANAAGIAGTFNPYSSDANFLVGAYIFEDVGVTAYHGAAPLIKSASILQTAASILAVEAYHAGLIRTTINLLDPVNAAGYLTLTDQISALRAKASLAANSAVTTSDDNGLLTATGAQPTGTSLGAGNTVITRTQTADADANFIAYSRNTTQVLNIVTLGHATTPGTVAAGGFFPNGLNGLFS